MRKKAIPKQKGPPLPLFSTLWDFPPFFGTVRLFKFLIFFRNFFCSSINFWYLATEWMFKKSQKAPFYIFRHYATYRKLFFSIFTFLRAFVVSSCRKSGFRVFLSLRYGADLGRSRLVIRFRLYKRHLVIWDKIVIPCYPWNWKISTG